MFGVNNFSAIVNPPQSCILAVGSTEKRIVPDASAEGGIGVRKSTVLKCKLRLCSIVFHTVPLELYVDGSHHRLLLTSVVVVNTA
jgi:hypothetical protein